MIVCIAALLLLATVMASQFTDAAAPPAAASSPSTGRRIQAGVQSSPAFFHRHHSWKSMPAVQLDQIHRINHHLNTTWKAGQKTGAQAQRTTRTSGQLHTSRWKNRVANAFV